jgi:Zinc knuckle
VRRPRSSPGRMPQRQWLVSERPATLFAKLRILSSCFYRHSIGSAPSTSVAGPKCYACGSLGHIAKLCPDTAAGDAPSQKCYTCGKEGHISRQCGEAGAAGSQGAFRQPAGLGGGVGGGVPTGPRAGGGKVVVLCFKCRGANHLARDCLAPVGAAAPAGRRPKCVARVGAV